MYYSSGNIAYDWIKIGVIYYHTAFYREFATLNLSGCIEYALLTNIMMDIKSLATLATKTAITKNWIETKILCGFEVF